jgi:hypothetical protein
MLGLPKATELNRQLPKKAIFVRFNPSAEARRLFDEQISRLAIVAEISPQTVSLAAGADVSAVYVILVTLKTAACDKKNIALLSKLIDQRMLFVLQYEGTARLAVYRAERVLMGETTPMESLTLNLMGLDLGAVWENIIAAVGGIKIESGGDLDAIIAENERRDKLIKQIAALDKKSLAERQPRRKLEMFEELKRLRAELEELGGQPQ